MNAYLFKQVDSSFLAVFRIGFGAIMIFECINMGVFLCLDCMYHSSSMLFKYHYFEWVHPWPTWGLRLHWLLMAVASVCIMLGWYYRWAMVFFLLGFAYMFWLDQALYLNHFYMVLLFSTLMVFVPANAYWSLDVANNRVAERPTIPNWSRFLLAAQLEIILIYAGLVKINSDWLNLEPMRLWMNEKSAQHNEFLQFLTQDWGIALASYGVIALHLIGAPLLLSRRYRLWALAAYSVFHTINAFVFNIGIFPWFTLFASLLFFEPDWPKTLWSKLQQRYRVIAERFPNRPISYGTVYPATGMSKQQWLLLVCVCGWLLVQVVVPWRHLALPGEVAWNESGHRFSWRMMLRSKRGDAVFNVKSASGREWEVKPAKELNAKQYRKMVCIPDMLWQFAQHIERTELAAGRGPVEVYASVHCSLNDRKRARMVDPSVDLTAISRTEPVDNWLLPLSEPLKKTFF